MALTPNDILDREFSVKLRGYNTEEVDTFLEEIAEFLTALIRKHHSLKDQVVACNSRIAKLKKREKEFREALTAAHKVTEEMQIHAKEKADLIVEKAKMDAERIVSDAHQEAVLLEEKIRGLRRLQREAVHKIRANLEGYLRILDDEQLPSEEFDRMMHLTAAEVRAIQGNTDENQQILTEIEAPVEADDASPDATEPSGKEQELSEVLEQVEEGTEQKDRKAGFGFDADKVWPDD
ncbi:MAG TPA: DivIVA domain-containing protein [Thermodesulfobacteriaceae bacterium]|nr:DivIVA domain-containing protein [Thermodesulfobacteriaceae bacterium]